LGLAGSHTDVLDRIMLHHEAARHLRALGRRREANAELGTARQLAADVGAVPYVERIDVDLAGVGRVAASAGADQLSSLTDRERDVVTLVVDGHTNRETANALYVSEKAVEWHLGNVFAKLGVTSRRQLKAALATA
jgi:DNA-binding CsgD family transcriptional regulator